MSLKCLEAEKKGREEEIFRGGQYTSLHAYIRHFWKEFKTRDASEMPKEGLEG